MAWEFRPIADSDLVTLHDWLSRPHVVEWWEPTSTLETVIEDYSPVIAGNPAHQCLIAHHEGVPVGFIQSYVATAFHHEGWWLDEQDPGVRGIDQFLADPRGLGKGIGTAMVRAFVATLFEDPAVTRIQTDPAPDNARAIRCYEKAGFVSSHIAATPDGDSLIMYCERA